MKIVRAVMVISVLLAAASVFASDWPQYLGPGRNATSDEKGLMRSWPAEGPKVLWTFPLAEGYAGPAVSEGKVYIYDRVENKTDILRCIDLVTGKEEWTFSYEAPGSVARYNGNKSVPAIDGNRIYICDLLGNLHCVDKKSHKAIWHNNIWTDFGGTDLPEFGIGQSPLLYQNLVIVAAQTKSTGLVAYDRETGKLAWKTGNLGDVGYVSPALVKISGADHVVMIPAGEETEQADHNSGMDPNETKTSAQGAGPGGAQGSAPGGGPGAPPAGAALQRNVAPKGTVTGFDPKTGAVLWTYTGFQCHRPVSNVLELGNNRLFMYGGDGGSAVIQIEKTGTSYTVKELLKNKFGAMINPAVLYKEYLYGNWYTLSARDGMVCMDLNCEVKWKTKKAPLFERGGLILVDDMIINNADGTFYLIEPTPEGFKMLSKAKLLEKKEEFVPFALSDGKLVVRGKTLMKCVQVK